MREFKPLQEKWTTITLYYNQIERGERKSVINFIHKFLSTFVEN